MRTIRLELEACDPPEGLVVIEDAGEPKPFSGWIELLGLLDTAVTGDETSLRSYADPG